MSKSKNPYIEHTSRMARAGRFLLGLKQKDLADEIGSSQGHISKIESGELLPELSDWISLCEHIGINAHESYLTGFIDGNSTKNDIFVVVDKLSGVGFGAIFKIGDFSLNPFVSWFHLGGQGVTKLI